MQDPNTKSQYKSHVAPRMNVVDDEPDAKPGKSASKVYNPHRTDTSKDLQPVSDKVKDPAAGAGIGRVVGCGVLSGLAAGFRAVAPGMYFGLQCI